MYLNLKKLHGRASIQVDQKLHWWTNIILRFPMFSLSLAMGGGGGLEEGTLFVFSLFTGVLMKYTNFYCKNVLTVKETWSLE